MRSNIKNIFLFSLVFLIACIFRLTNLDLIEFKADEAINLFLASRPIFGYPFPPGSTVSSLGVLNFPLFNYMLFPFVLISRDPKLISFFIALINALSVGILYLIFKKYYGQTVGIISSVIIALSPWAILFSRKIWIQDLVIPLTIPLLFAIHKIIFDKENKYYLLLAFSLLILIQLYLPSIFFVVPFLVLLFAFKNHIDYKYFIAGGLIGLIPTIPYLAYQITNACPDCQALFAVNDRLNPQYFSSIFIRPFQILGRGNFQTVLGDDMLTLSLLYPLSYHAQKIFYLEYILIPIGAILYFKKYIRMRFLLLSAIALPIVYYLLHLEPFIHYFIILVPLLSLFVGVAITRLFELNQIGRIAAISIFLLICSASIAFNTGFYSLIRANGGLKGNYGGIYENSARDHKKLLANYINDPHYEEMYLTSFIPYNLMHGNIGIAKTIYPRHITEAKLPELEKRLKEFPLDPRVHAELIAYYTDSPSLSKLIMLAHKTAENQEFVPIYNEVKDFYRFYYR